MSIRLSEDTTGMAEHCDDLLITMAAAPAKSSKKVLISPRTRVFVRNTKTGEYEQIGLINKISLKASADSALLDFTVTFSSKKFVDKCSPIVKKSVEGSIKKLTKLGVKIERV